MKKTILLLSALLLLPACKGKQPEPEVQQIQYGMPKDGQVVDANHGRETSLAYGAMAGVNGTPANGVAQAHSFEDGHYLHTIQLNIEAAPDGSYYEGWISKEGASPVSTGQLTNAMGDVRHSVRFEAQKDFTGYLNVTVTLEKDDGNPAPSDRVAEGVMRVTER